MLYLFCSGIVITEVRRRCDFPANFIASSTMLRSVSRSPMLHPLNSAKVQGYGDNCLGAEPSVTAIIPTHRRPHLVMRALDSALKQTYPRLNVILVIDGKDEQTCRLANELKESRLRIVELRSRVGAAQARNIGVDLSTTDWVAFLDDDDEWLPEKIAKQMEAARRSTCKYPVVSTRTIVRAKDFDWISPDRPYRSGEPISEYLFCRRRFVDGARYMQTSTLLMPKDLMLKFPFRDLKRHQDWDWLLRAAAYPGVEFRMHPEPLAVFHVDEGRSSIGRELDWQFSQSWARQMQSAFTPRAYSFFIANECVTRAVKSNAGVAAYAGLVRDFCQGRPTVRSLLPLLAFLSSTERLRGWLKRRVRSVRAGTRQSSAPAAGA